MGPAKVSRTTQELNLRVKIKIKLTVVCVCVSIFSVTLEKWAYQGTDLPRTGKKCTETIRTARERVYISCTSNF